MNLLPHLDKEKSNYSGIVERGAFLGSSIRLRQVVRIAPRWLCGGVRTGASSQICELCSNPAGHASVHTVSWTSTRPQFAVLACVWWTHNSPPGILWSSLEDHAHAETGNWAWLVLHFSLGMHCPLQCWSLLNPTFCTTWMNMCELLFYLPTDLCSPLVMISRNW